MALATFLDILALTYVQVLPLWQARGNFRFGRYYLYLKHWEHACNDELLERWMKKKKTWRVLFRTFPFNAATVPWETYLGLELMTSWHGILWSHHTVIVSKGVLFCLHPIFFSHKIVFYKLWFRKHFQINKIYRGAPLPVTLGLPSWEQAVVMGRI